MLDEKMTVPKTYLPIYHQNNKAATSITLCPHIHTLPLPPLNVLWVSLQKAPLFLTS